MHPLQTPLTIHEILSKAPGNPVLWHLFLAELASAMQCDSGFLSIADLSCSGGIHHLYRYNVAPEQQSWFERNLRKAGSFDASVKKQPYRVFYSNTLNMPASNDDGAWPGATTGHCRFGVSMPLNRRYAYCIYLNSVHLAQEPECQASVQRLQALVPALQHALQREQWFGLYNQITLLTGKHAAAYIIVDRALNVLFSDPVFNRVIADMDCVEIQGKRLGFLNKSTERQVLAMLAEIGGGAVTLQGPSCAYCDITAIPARALDNLYAWEFYRKGVALTFSRGHENSPTLLRLMALYNLTKGEALCALQFIATPSVPEIAASSSRSKETVRNHIKSIMHKLGVHNQGALMKKLLAIAAL